jgi:hypothetical protein
MKTRSGGESGLAFPHSRHGADGRDQADEHDGQRLQVFVVFTNTTGTLAALQMAERLSKKLEARLQVLMPYEVPYTLPLTEPAVPAGFLEEQLRTLAHQAPMEIAAHVYLCRDKRRTLRLILRPYSLVVVGGRKRWFPTPEQRLAQALKRDGHHVIFAELR